MTFDERVRALEPLGFTPRQTRFLVTVALHSGYCLRRQYVAFAGLQYGKNVRDFLDELVDAPARRRALHVPRRSRPRLSPAGAVDLPRARPGRQPQSPRGERRAHRAQAHAARLRARRSLTSSGCATEARQGRRSSRDGSACRVARPAAARLCGVTTSGPAPTTRYFVAQAADLPGRRAADACTSSTSPLDADRRRPSSGSCATTRGCSATCRAGPSSWSARRRRGRSRGLPRRLRRVHARGRCSRRRGRPRRTSRWFFVTRRRRRAQRPGARCRSPTSTASAIARRGSPAPRSRALYARVARATATRVLERDRRASPRRRIGARAAASTHELPFTLRAVRRRCRGCADGPPRHQHGGPRIGPALARSGPARGPSRDRAIAELMRAGNYGAIAVAPTVAAVGVGRTWVATGLRAKGERPPVSAGP